MAHPKAVNGHRRLVLSRNDFRNCHPRPRFRLFMAWRRTGKERRGDPCGHAGSRPDLSFGSYGREFDVDRQRLHGNRSWPFGHRQRKPNRFCGRGAQGKPDLSALDRRVAADHGAEPFRPGVGRLGSSFRLCGRKLQSILPADDVSADRLGTASATAEEVGPLSQLALSGIVADLAACSFERLVAIYSDHSGARLACETLAQGSAREVSVTARRLVARCLSFDAAGVTLLHNHPSGCAEPSGADIRQTLRLRELLGPLDINLIDHLIVGKDTLFSLRTGRVF